MPRSSWPGRRLGLALWPILAQAGGLAATDWIRPPVQEGAWVRTRGYDRAESYRLDQVLPRARVRGLAEDRALVETPWGVAVLEVDRGWVGSVDLPDGWTWPETGWWELAGTSWRSPVVPQSPELTEWTRQVTVHERPCGVRKVDLPVASRTPTPVERPVAGLMPAVEGVRGHAAAPRTVADLMAESPRPAEDTGVTAFGARQAEAAFRRESWFLCDGRLEGSHSQVMARRPTLVEVDRVAGTVAAVQSDDLCPVARVRNALGISLLNCEDGRVLIFDGEQVHEEPGLTPDALSASLLWLADGTLLFRVGGRGWVRAPASPGRGGWREVRAPGSGILLPGPGGRAWAGVVADGGISLTDETGEVVATSGPLPLGEYAVFSSWDGILVVRVASSSSGALLLWSHSAE